MKYRVTLSISLLMLFAVCAAAQIEIAAEKRVYTRTGANVPDFKKTFEVTYPSFLGLAPEVKKNLDQTVDYWTHFGLTLEESLSDYTWLDSMDYEVNYNKNGLLDIALMMEGSGAYPDGQVKTIVVDMKTGRRLRINDVFTNIGGLVLKIDKAQQAEIRKAKLDLMRDGVDDAESLDDYLGDKRFSVRTLDEFSISDSGVTFIYDYGFPHVVRALEPEGRYFFVWTDMRPHIKRRGALAPFVNSKGN